MEPFEFEEPEGSSLSDDSWSSVEETGVLIVAPSPPDSDFRGGLESEGCNVAWEENLETASRRDDADAIDVVVVDEEILDPDRGTKPRALFETRPVSLLRVDEQTPAGYARVLDLEFDSFVRHDIGPASLLRLIEQELRVRSDSNAESDIQTPERIVGESEAMSRVCRLAAGAAASTASALISGESGVGKELVAKAIHRLSPRRRRPFVAINCGAIPENLIESELFGHEEGAFTGATSDRVGRFEQADTGTLLLDEVGELPKPMQVKLLRVLEDQTFERVGGTESISVDVRVLSATNRDLTVDIERDRFRRDLFFRLDVLEIGIPPLRDHREDIAPLWGHFVRQAASKEARPPPRTSQEIQRKLYRYDWPGNIRELRNVARHAVALSADDVLKVEHLPERFRNELQRQARSTPGNIQVPGMTLDEVERAAIIRTHDWSSGVSETANMLGISERKVYYKLKEYREEGFLPAKDEQETTTEEDEDRGSEASSDDKPRLVIAEDDRQLQWTFRELLESEYDVVTVTTGRRLVDEVQTERPDLILSDIRMPGLDGIQVLRQSHAEQWDIPIVLVTAYGDEENRAQAELLGASAMLDKPVDADRLRSELRDALESSETDS